MLPRTHVSCPLVLALLFAVAFVTTPASAQCGPDNLDGGPCCTPAGVVLPAFPNSVMPSRWICFDNCQTVQQFTYCTTLGTPLPVQSGGAIVCGDFVIRVKVRDCGTGTVLWNGSLNAFYSRTWRASSVAGAVNLQVWRFIVNGDMLATPALPANPCQKPTCSPPFSRLYMSGYVDYALDCAANTWQVAWMLDHECDSVHHAPGTSRPAPAAGLHPTRSFTMVAPDAGFIVSPASPNMSNGQIVQQAIRRNDWTASPAICTYEEACQGSFQAQNQFCQCGTVAAIQYINTIVTAVGACGSRVSPSALGPFEQKRIGRWTNPNVYPGNQYVLFDFGYLDTLNGCTGASTLEWYEGVETIRGYPAYDFAGNLLGSQFEDLASANNSATNPAIKIGAPHVVYWFLNFNLP